MVTLMYTAGLSMIAMDQPAQKFWKSFKPQELSKYIEDVPGENSKRITDWMKKHLSLINALVELPINKTWTDFCVKHHANLSLLRKNNIINYGGSFIFSLPDTGYMMQIAGTKHRGLNLFGREGLKEDQTPNKPLPNNVSLATYHTVSRFVPYLIYSQMQKDPKQAFKHFSIQPTYLVHIPEKPKLICDDNYCIVQKKGFDAHMDADAVDVRKYPHRLSKVSDKQFKELCRAVVALGLWDVSKNLWLNKDGNFVVGDTEHYFWNKPENFFRRNKDAVVYEIFRGLGQVGGFYNISYMPQSLAQILFNRGYTVRSQQLSQLVNGYIDDTPMLSASLKKAKKSSVYKHRFSAYFGPHPHPIINYTPAPRPSSSRVGLPMMPSVKHEQIPGWEANLECAAPGMPIGPNSKVRMMPSVEGEEIPQ